MPCDENELRAINASMQRYSAEDVVDWAARRFGHDLIMSSSFGAESAAMLHLVTQRMPGIRVIVIDTGYLFAETRDFLRQLREQMNLNVLIYRPAHDAEDYLARANELDPTVRQDVASCCAVNKNEPFDRAMRELRPHAWLRGIRREQASTRESRQIVEWSDRYDCYAISPLLNWSTKQVHAYMKKHALPCHPLYEKGYASIGCSPITCTRPIQIGEDPRAGRWSGQAKVECGLHIEPR